MHDKFMRLALDLAIKAQGQTSPNPMVGAVIVKDERIISTGYHRRSGLDHAEVAAIKNASANIKDASLYVNLEPCSHYGKTPPCTAAIIKSGIKKVYVGMIDPNPVNNSRGIRILRNAGIKVSVGILEPECKKLNEVFIKYISKKMPFVTVKLAQSLDGKIATCAHDSKWITNEKSREFVHKARFVNDAVLVGVNTIIRDDPILSARLKEGIRYPIKVVLDPHLKAPLSSKIFLNESGSDVILAVTADTPKAKIKRFAGKAKILIAKKKNGAIDLKDLLKKLGRFEITSLLVEGGGETAASFFEQGVVDKALFFIAPKIIGGRDAVTSVEGAGVKKVSDAIQLKNIELQRIGDDILVEGYVYRNN